LLSIKLNTNGISSQFSHKNSLITSKILQRKNLYDPIMDLTKKNKTYTYLTRSFVCDNNIKASKRLNFNVKNNMKQFTLLSDILCNKKRNEFLTFNAQKQFSTIMTPDILTNYVCSQLDKHQKFKNRFFRVSGLNLGIMSIVTHLLQYFKNSIIGLKIIIAGKWRKTASGRKQRILLKFGRIQSNCLKSTIMHSYKSQKTKFGTCSIKV